MPDGSYPRYLRYEGRREPSVLHQVFPKPAHARGGLYYPPSPLLERYFASDDERQRFGVASFCGFLADTIEVEHCLVVPAIAAMRRLPYRLPAEVEQDLFKCATDEGFHAEQAVAFLSELRQQFNLRPPDVPRLPLFLRRLEEQRLQEPESVNRDLMTVINGIVTETRISIELGQFAANRSLAEPVRDVCRLHAGDEAIHSSQFRALGQWLWSKFDDDARRLASTFFAQSLIARNLPDHTRTAICLQQATARPLDECRSIVLSTYDAERLLEDLSWTAKPTLTYLHDLGVERYISLRRLLEVERARLVAELDGEICELEQRAG